MSNARVTRALTIPDPLRISRYQKIPELGPHILFFSGGSALTGLSRTLKRYTHNSTHLVTPFDSGGSSAELRRAFNMPSIGDLRSRLMALADETILGHPEIYELFNTRFPKGESNEHLKKRLATMVDGKAEEISEIANPMRRLISNHLGYFQAAMPDDFKLQGASIGNLILAGGYLNNHQHLDPICFLFSKLVNVLGTVRTIVNEDLHLVAELTDGKKLIGQHLITGKEAPPLTQAIKKISLSSSAQKDIPSHPELKKKNRRLIESAELICYPPGSFYSSLLTNLLPSGIGEAITHNGNPKVYIPNLGYDPEQQNMSMADSVDILLKHLRAESGNKKASTDKLLNFILLDSREKYTLHPITRKECKELGVQLIDTRLVSRQSRPYYDTELLVSTLLSLI